MTSRSKRTLSIALGIGVLAGGAGAAYAIHARSHTASRTEASYDGGSYGIVDGTTSAQLERRLGPPTRKQGSCWIYQVRDNTLAGLATYPGSVDAVRYCFYSGVVTDIADHQPKAGDGPAWIPPAIFGSRACVSLYGADPAGCKRE